MTKLIALVDGSMYSRSVCDHAAWIAKRADAEVEILHVLTRRQTENDASDLSGNIALGARTALLNELSDLDAQMAKLAQKHGRAILEDAHAALTEDGVSLVTTKLRAGDIIETLNDVEADADLLVIGKRGEAADFAKLHLGSNLERIVRTSHKPVFVAARAFQPISKVLVALDGGASSLKAIDHMSRSPVFAGLEIQVVTVGTETPQNRKMVEDACATLAGGGHKASAAVLPGQADKAIAARVEAENIDLLVMGAYGHSRIRTLIIGSTTTEMIRSCKIPILLFR